MYKKHCLSLESIQDSTFFLLILFSIYKMVDIMDIYRSLNINIETVMKNPEVIKLVPDHLKS